MYNIEKIRKLYKELKCPRVYWSPNLEQLFSNDYYMSLSIRQDNGKTTNALLTGLCCHKIHGTHILYLRCDKAQTTFSKVATLFDVVRDCGYIALIYSEYNDIIYKKFDKAFYLVFRNDDNEIVTQSEEPICRVVCLEDWQDYKSGFNDVKANFCIFDEFMDSRRFTGFLMTELANCISTFGRGREDFHVLMLANNTNKFSHWFDDFCIRDTILYLDYGRHANITSELGTTIYIEMLSLTAKRLSQIENKQIRFFGFNTPKMAQFTGVATWQGFNYRQLDFEPLSNDLIAFIKHRNLFIAVNLVTGDGVAPHLFMTKFNEPRKDDIIVYTQEPIKLNERLFEDAPQIIKKCVKNNQICFLSNDIGLLFDDFKRK